MKTTGRKSNAYVIAKFFMDKGFRVSYRKANGILKIYVALNRTAGLLFTFKSGWIKLHICKKGMIVRPAKKAYRKTDFVLNLVQDFIPALKETSDATSC